MLDKVGSAKGVEEMRAQLKQQVRHIQHQFYVANCSPILL